MGGLRYQRGGVLLLLHTGYVNEVLCHSGPVDGNRRVLIIQQKLDFIREHGITLVVMSSDYGLILPLFETQMMHLQVSVPNN